MKKEFQKAFQVSIPVMMGYLVLGTAFGLLLVSFNYPWYLASLMSIVIYAGALQFVAVGFLNAKLAVIDVAIATFFINIRQSFYGLSFIQKFKDTKPFKNYLIFGLTDETYALLSSIKEEEKLSKKHYYFFLTLLNQIYWIVGSSVGAIVGMYIEFNSSGLEFSLTALFVVLSIEQYKSIKKKTPFLIGAFTATFALVFVPSDKMLIVAILFSFLLMSIFKKSIENDH